MSIISPHLGAGFVASPCGVRRLAVRGSYRPRAGLVGLRCGVRLALDHQFQFVEIDPPRMDLSERTLVPFWSIPFEQQVQFAQGCKTAFDLIIAQLTELHERGHALIASVRLTVEGSDSIHDRREFGVVNLEPLRKDDLLEVVLSFALRPIDFQLFESSGHRVTQIVLDGSWQATLLTCVESRLYRAFDSFHRIGFDGSFEFLHNLTVDKGRPTHSAIDKTHVELLGSIQVRHLQFRF